MPLLSLSPLGHAAPLALPRYVLLVVDDPGGTIATRLASAGRAAEIVPCASYHEAGTALLSGRRYSAVVGPCPDAELARPAGRAGVPLISVGRAWPPAAVASAIEANAVPVPRVGLPPCLGPAPGPLCGSEPFGVEGRLVAVCGPGGTGTSTVAAALARALAGGLAGALPSAFGGDRARDVADRADLGDSARGCPVPVDGHPVPVGGHPVPVLLADFARRADQAFLHGVDQEGTGLVMLAQSGRYRPIGATDIRRTTVPVGGAGLRLLPGLRRPANWTAVSPWAFDEVLCRLLEHFDRVVADITADFEGEAEGGSVDVEERNHPARRTARDADVVVAVGRSGAHGTRRLAQVVDDLLDLGVEPSRVQPVTTGGDGSSGPGRLCGLPAAPLALALALGPGPEVQPLAAAVSHLLATVPRVDRTLIPVPVAPGSLGCPAR